MAASLTQLNIDDEAIAAWRRMLDDNTDVNWMAAGYPEGANNQLVVGTIAFCAHFWLWIHMFFDSFWEKALAVLLSSRRSSVTRYDVNCNDFMLSKH